jgi:tetratricopeptide (TPR) repeat protein
VKHAGVWAIALCAALACSTVSDKDLERAQTYRQLAELRVSKGELNAAVREYGNSLKFNERSAETHFGMGEALRRLGSLGDAQRHFERAVQLDPEHQDARLNLSAVHLEEKRWADAIRETTRLIEDPSFLNPGRAYVNRGWAHYQLGELDLAEADLREALRTNSSAFQAHLDLGIVLFERGKVGESVQSFERVVHLLEPYDNPRFACAQAEARFRLAQAYVAASDRPSAMKQLEKVEAGQIPCTWGDQARAYLARLGP